MWLDYLHPRIPDSIERYLVALPDAALRRVVERPLSAFKNDGIECLVQAAGDSSRWAYQCAVAYDFDHFAIQGEYSHARTAFVVFGARSTNPAISAVKASAAAILAERDAQRIEAVIAESRCQAQAVAAKERVLTGGIDD